MGRLKSKMGGKVEQKRKAKQVEKKANFINAQNPASLGQSQDYCWCAPDQYCTEPLQAPYWFTVFTIKDCGICRRVSQSTYETVWLLSTQFQCQALYRLSLYKASKCSSTIPACSFPTSFEHLSCSLPSARSVYLYLPLAMAQKLKNWVKATVTVSPNPSPSVQSTSPVQSRVQVLHLPEKCSCPGK